MKAPTTLNKWRLPTTIAWQHHAIIFMIAFIILVSREPDRILAAQFWAEDGTVFFADAYNLDFPSSLVLPYAGYLCVVQRLVASFAQLFPLEIAPLISNSIALAIQALPVNFIISSRFSALIPSLSVRFLLAFLYLALPTSAEIHANIASAQWYLALLACLVVLATPSKFPVWRFLDVAIVLLSALSGPFALLLIPVAFLRWRLRPNRWLIGLVLALVIGILVQGLAVLLISTSSRYSTALGATVDLFFRIMSGQVFLTALIGQEAYEKLIAQSDGFSPIAYLVGALGLIAVLYAFLQGPLELRMFILFAALISAAALASATVPWKLLWRPGAATRYWFIPILAFITSLIWLAHRQRPDRVRIVAIAMLIVMCTGIIGDWQRPPMVDLNFKEYAKNFEQAPQGTIFIIPINPPGWPMQITKH